MNIYKLSTSLWNFIMKWFFFCYVQKRQKHLSKWDSKNIFSEQWSCLLCAEHKNCYITTKFNMLVEKLYMFITNFFQNFLKCFTIYFEFFVRQEQVSSGSKTAFSYLLSCQNKINSLSCTLLYANQNLHAGTTLLNVVNTCIVTRSWVPGRHTGQKVTRSGHTMGQHKGSDPKRRPNHTILKYKPQQKRRMLDLAGYTM